MTTIAEYSTNIIDRLYQTIENRDRYPPAECPLKITSKITVTVEVMEFI